MNYSLYVLAFLWAFWAMYVLVMGIYRAHLAKRLTPVTLALSLPFVALGYVMDVLADNTIAQVTKAELQEALRLSGAAMAELWVMPYKTA